MSSLGLSGLTDLPGIVFELILEKLSVPNVNSLRRLNSWFKNRISDEYWIMRMRMFTHPTNDRQDLTPFERFVYHYSRHHVCRGSERFIHPIAALAKALVNQDHETINYLKLRMPLQGEMSQRVIMNFVATIDDAELFVDLSECQNWDLIDTRLPGTISPEIVYGNISLLPPDSYASILRRIFPPPIGICEDIILAIQFGDDQIMRDCISNAKCIMDNDTTNYLSFHIMRSIEIAAFAICGCNRYMFVKLLEILDHLNINLPKVILFAAYSGYSVNETSGSIEWSVRGGHYRYDKIINYPPILIMSVLRGLATRNDHITFERVIKTIKEIDNSLHESEYSEIALIAITKNYICIFDAVIKRLSIGESKKIINIAIEMGRFEIVMLLMDKIGRNNLTKDDMKTLLFIAVTWCKLDIVKILLDDYFGPEDDLVEALMLAARINGISAARLLIEKMSPKTSRCAISKALFVASEQKQGISFLREFVDVSDIDLRLVTSWVTATTNIEFCGIITRNDR